MTYQQFFKTATGNEPYDYQLRLAGGHPDAPCESKLINIPTGLGKTAAVVLAWLWNRVHLQNEKWPRRLVCCLPMRTLVEQTEDNVSNWLGDLWHKRAELGLSEEALTDLRWLSGEGSKEISRSPIILMGGEELSESKREWDIHPEKPAILIGTQDMLLSRALNRGYGLARARWPMHFGLLNNDCLWVLDETQLMGVGVRTSAQLEGLRQKLGVFGKCATWWASATLDERLLATPDHKENVIELALETSDRQSPGVSSRIAATKHLHEVPFSLTADSEKVVAPYIEKLASMVVEKHQPNTITIVILNRVDRAQDLFAALDKTAKSQSLPDRVLVHSRFRPTEREYLSKQIKGAGSKIIVATQAIEAGVDISARTLITELAPWSSLIQRFGRCNRKGEFNEKHGADIFWINLEAADEKSGGDVALPYAITQLTNSRALLRGAQAGGASPAALEKVHSLEPLAESHILRRKDLIELFDTTPDLAGLDIDVGRYIRDGEDRDVQVFWRNVPDQEDKRDQIRPLRQELVRVSVNDFEKFLKKNKKSIWVWNPLDADWQRPERPAPGQIYLVDYSLGGYSETLGWTGEKAKEGFKILTCDDQSKRGSSRDGQGIDDESLLPEGTFQSIEQHTAEVVDAFDGIARDLHLEKYWMDVLRTAAQWHDLGKAHPCFQSFVTKGRTVPENLKENFIAKAPWRPGGRHSRPHFRHELASALAWLQAAKETDGFKLSLVAFLIAAHHGKVRLSIRSMPGEKVPENLEPGSDILFARGIWHGEEIPSDQTRKLIIDNIPFAPMRLNLSCMKMGEQNGLPSWTARTLSLRDDARLGIFRLAYLETILRAADGLASATPFPGFPAAPPLALREEPPSYGGEQTLSDAERTLVAEVVKDGLSIQKKFRPEPLYKETGKGHYESNTVEEIRQAKRSKGR